MTLKFLDLNPAEPHTEAETIRTSAEVIALFDSIKTRPPFFGELVGENDFKLLVGFGEEFGCIQFSPADGEPPYLMAVGTCQPALPEYLQFLVSNAPSDGTLLSANGGRLADCVAFPGDGGEERHFHLGRDLKMPRPVCPHPR